MGGYSTLAAFMGANPEAAILKRFCHLNMENILLLQAELADIETQYRAVSNANQASSDSERNKFSRDWYTLSSAEDRDGACEQWKLALRLREKLREYNDAVLQYHQLSKIPKPNRRTLNSFLEWKSRPNMGDVYLIGRDRNIWDEGEDLMVLKVLPDDTTLIQWFRRCLPTIFRAFGKYFWNKDTDQRFGSNTATYSDSKVFKIAGLFGTVLASLLPVAAIAVLYSIHSMALRIGLLAIFTTIFSVGLWFLSDGRVIEVFAATSAFAAVQVVFIGTNITTS